MADKIDPNAFRAVALSPAQLVGPQILCRECARSYTAPPFDERYEVHPATFKEVEDALFRISEDLIGRIGPVGDRAPACYECEAEL